MEVCEETEKQSDRALSPVLNSTKLFRKKKINHKSSSKTRVRLSKLFDGDNVEMPENINVAVSDCKTSKFNFKKPLSPKCTFKRPQPDCMDFYTASGNSIVVLPDAIKKRSEIYKDVLELNLNNNQFLCRKDFSIRCLESRLNNVSGRFMPKKGLSSDFEESEIVRAADTVVCSINSEINVKNTETLNFIGFSTDECDNANEKLQQFNTLLNAMGPPCKKFKINVDDLQDCNVANGSEHKDILDSSLCEIFADEDLSLMASVHNQQNSNANSVSLQTQHNNNFGKFEMMGGFSTANGKSIPISVTALRQCEKLFEDKNLLSTLEEQFCKKIADIPETKQNLNTQDVKSSTMPGFVASTSQSTEIFDRAWKRGTNLSTNEDLSPTASVRIEKNDGINSVAMEEGIKNLGQLAEGFSTANGKNIHISGRALSKVKKLFEDTNLDLQTKVTHYTSGFASAAGQSIQISDQTWKKANNLFSDELLVLPTNDECNQLFPNCTTTTSNDSARQTLEKRHIIGGSNKKKRLGVSGCKQIQIDKSSMAKAKLQLTEICNTNSLPKMPKQLNVYSSTPLKTNSNENVKSTSDFLTNLNITPVKHVKKLDTNQNDSVVVQEPFSGNIQNCIENIKKEFDDLQYRIKIITERRKALEEQQKILQSESDTCITPVLGVLSKRKQRNARISLKEAVGSQKPSCISFKNSITLQNATSIHFNCSWGKNGEYPAVVYSKDGAILIPNSNNLIGLFEIKNAFEVMRGVDQKLIPKGWITNHFKLIVWKLASLDQHFPDVFNECLTVENVIQQLKYRYDREIDKSERSALHRILEKDDVPQKRMVLCVSDIIQDGVVLEIELTDGWYCVRTIIDDLLKFQINSLKIVIGTKLIVQGAQILNSDGCHPLEIADHVRLKINYNSTRRAAWYARLGFQKNMQPFPVHLNSIHTDGGCVGCISVHIVRVYPIRYMEKTDSGKPVWRNRKAEDKKVQKWETERMKELEMIHDKVREEYKKDLENKQNDIKINWNKLSEVESPELLCRMLEACGSDSVDFKDQLSASQLSSALQYRQSISEQINLELSTRISEKMAKVQKYKREVYSVLKLKVIDCLNECSRPFFINIWRPSEEHLQILKEGLSFFVYNVLLKSSGELASTNKTQFQNVSVSPSEAVKYQRNVLLISALKESRSNADLPEYDTIGTIVQINKFEHNQEVWVTDFNKNLLHIRICEGADTCCLLDNLNRGQAVAFMNLLQCESRICVPQGIANQCSVITKFPQQKFLQDSLASYSKQMPNDLVTFLDNCDKIIGRICVTYVKELNASASISQLSVLIESGSYQNILDDGPEDNTMIPSQLTTTDVAMSLIDTDQYFENM